MIKSEELVRGTIAKAKDDEPLFVLRAQDALAPAAIRYWAGIAKQFGTRAKKIEEALELARQMEAWPARKVPD